MTRWLRRTMWAMLTLALALALTAWVGQIMGERKMQRVIAIEPAALQTTPGGVSLQQGRYLFATRGCADCHGASGAGQEVIRSGRMLVASPNITSGASSATAAYRERDWVRTLRHGVKPNGRPVMIMPSEDYNRLSDNDLASIIAYVRQLPPVAGTRALVQLPRKVKVLYAAGVVRDAAELIDHSLAPQPPVAPAVNLAHGGYVARSCMGCHGEHMSGGRIPGAPPEWPAPANLTPGEGSAMVRYPSPQSFMAMLRSGLRPDGSAISSVMPFGSLRQMNEVDVFALHAYLQALPARRAGQR
ncbi:cytochrome c [Massilia sp. CF038]|uniref:c-type cytochrome n=1 Tax=Massilia sp. CF038 TaxID=1881045 RepID=UPI00091C98BB|nr:cytochrome c [Massilia sp. CF038]SHH16214.1 Cytochrome c [Massilia sp. CF038]